MKYLDEYRDAEAAGALARRIARVTTRPWTIMEICGGQTHTLIKSGIDRMLPPEITLVHGPGCPVCVTPLELIDKALEIARQLCLGLGAARSAVFGGVINAALGPPTSRAPSLTVNVDRINAGRHGSDTGVYDEDGALRNSFEELY